MPTNSENQLDASHDFVDLFENGALGLHFVGADGIILNANQAELDFLGYSREEYIGHHIAQFHVDAPVIERHSGSIKPEGDAQKLRSASASEGWLHQACAHHVQCPLEERHFVHTRCFTRDITDRKKVEEERERLVHELRQTHKRLEEKVQELEEFHDVVVNRELKMMALEKEVEQLRADNARLQITLQHSKHSS